MPQMLNKHRTGPTRDEKTNKLHNKLGRRHQANSKNIVQLMTARYSDNIYILVIVMASSLTDSGPKKMW